MAVQWVDLNCKGACFHLYIVVVEGVEKCLCCFLLHIVAFPLSLSLQAAQEFVTLFLGTKWGILRGCYKGVHWKPPSKLSLNGTMQMCSLDWETNAVCSDPVDSEECLKSPPSSLNRVKPQRELLQVTSLLAFKHCFGNPALELLTLCWYCCNDGWRIQWEGCASCLCSLYSVLWVSCMGHILPFLRYALCSWLPWLEAVHFLLADLVSKSVICTMWLQQCFDSCLIQVWSWLQAMWLEGLIAELISLAVSGSGGSSWLLGHGAMQLPMSWQCGQLAKLFQHTRTKQAHFLRGCLTSQTEAAPFCQLTLASQSYAASETQSIWSKAVCFKLHLFLFLRWRLLLSTAGSLTFLQQAVHQSCALPLLIHFIFRV